MASSAIKRAWHKLYGRSKLTEEKLKEFSPVERMMICTCEICIPGPSVIDENCPVHWDLHKKIVDDINKPVSISTRESK